LFALWQTGSGGAVWGLQTQKIVIAIFGYAIYDAECIIHLLVISVDLN
jgi:hypothetical protein